MPLDNSELHIEISGDDLLSVAVADTGDAQALADQLRDTGDWLECVAGIHTVVVQFDAAVLDCDAALGKVQACLAEGIRRGDETDELVEIPVHYGGAFGPDFDEVCERQGLTADELIALHTEREYRVDMVGFTPGFAFIGGLNERLNVPRRGEPRQCVDAGSVGIADGRTGLYALAVPGGWQLIGRTTLPLFDPAATPPNRLRAGMRVRFIAVAEDGE